MQELETWLAAHPWTGLAVSLILVVILAGTIFRSRFQGSGTSLHTLRILRKSWRWLADHLVQLLAALLMVTSALLLASRILAPGPFDPAQEDLVLLALILGLAALAQSGSALFRRLKKVGPVEFVEERFDRILPELKEWSRYVDVAYVNLDTDKRPSPMLLWENEKAEMFVTHLEWSGIEASGLKEKEKFHDLLFKMSMVAMLDRRWAPAINWLELLLKITDGKFKAADTHYRCGIAYWKLADSLGDSAPEEKEKVRMYRKAQDQFGQAVKNDPHSHLAYFNLAYVQFLLQEYSLALKNNDAAIEILPGYALAKYNRALCFLKLGKLEESLGALQSIALGDRQIETVTTFAFKDPDLQPLLRHPRLGPEAKAHLDSLTHPAGSTGA